MEKILYIQASPLGDESFSIRVADAFLESCRAAHPETEVDTVNLFDLDMPSFDTPYAKAKYAKMFGGELSAEEGQAWERVEEIVNRFTSADKYVFAVPMWNFGIPHILKQYIDHLVQPGYTFDATAEKGKTGLVGNKPAFAVYSRGGEYRLGPEGDPFDYQKSYMEAVLAFIGIKDVRSVVVQPTLAGGPEAAQEALGKAQEEARELGADF